MKGAQAEALQNRTSQIIKHVKLSGNSHLLVDLINTAGKESKAYQDIEVVSAETGCTGAIGVAGNVNMSNSLYWLIE